jgi:ABC-type Zn uptake system ZnuABC Zn-binding protein ZnuA
MLPSRVRPLLGTVILGATAVLAAGCGNADEGASSGQVKVVATTTQIADFAREVGGDRAVVMQLLKPNTDPHEYEPRPSDVRASTDATVVLENGDNLDRWMSDIVEQAGGHPTVIDLGSRVPVRLAGESSGPEASRYDPHWWHDPRNALATVIAIRDALTKANPKATRVYARNASAYRPGDRQADRSDKRPHALRRHAGAEGHGRQRVPADGARQRRRDGPRLHRRAARMCRTGKLTPAAQAATR